MSSRKKWEEENEIWETGAKSAKFLGGRQTIGDRGDRKTTSEAPMKDVLPSGVSAIERSRTSGNDSSATSPNTHHGVPADPARTTPGKFGEKKSGEIKPQVKGGARSGTSSTVMRPMIDARDRLSTRGRSVAITKRRDTKWERKERGRNIV